MNIFSLAVNRPVATSMVFVAILAIGFVAVTGIGRELLPDITFPVIAVIVDYANVGPEEIESLITRPIEGAVSTVNNVRSVNSTSREGSSVVTVEFEWGTDLDQAAIDVREKVDLIRDFLPSEASEPVVVKFDISLSPMIVMGMSGRRSSAELFKLAEEKVRNRLERLDGVASVSISGQDERAILVKVDAAKLRALDLSIDRVIAALRAENMNLPGGKIQRGRREFILRTIGEFRSLDQIRNVIIGSRRGVPIYLKDVGAVESGYKDRESIVRNNLNTGLIILVQKQAGKNTVEVADRVAREISEIRKILPRDVSIESVWDQSEVVRESIDSVIRAALQGGILALLVIFVFLRSGRSTLIVGVSIPISIISTFILMYFSGITFNIISLGGLALGVGMLVDGSIVVLENVFRHRYERGEDAKTAAIEGSGEVGTAIIASTLTTVAVFLPVVFVKGIAGEFFKDMAVTVTFSLMASLVVALSLIPMLTSKFLQAPAGNSSHPLWAKFTRSTDAFFERVDLYYRGILSWALSHRRAVIATAVLLFLGSLVLIPLVGVDFIPAQDVGLFTVNIKMPVGTTLSETDKVVRLIEEKVRGIPELSMMSSEVGSGGFFGAGSQPHRAQIFVKLVSPEHRRRSDVEIRQALLDEIGKISGADIRAETEGRIGGGGSPVRIDIRGFDLEEGKRLAEQIRGIVESVRGTRNVKTSLDEGKPELQFRIDRDKASSMGLSVSSIANAIKASVAGAVATKYRVRGDEYDVIVRLRDEDRATIDDLTGIFVSTPAGAMIPVGNITSVVSASGPVSIERKNQERVIAVTADLIGRDLGSVISEIKDRIASQVAIPGGFEVAFSGSAQDLAESFSSLGLALLLAIGLTYMIMAAQFESLLDPFIIMFSVPLAVIGVVLMFVLTGTIFNVNAFIGTIMLEGIVVNNAIVLVDYTNRLRRDRGMGISEAILEAGRTRLRPILMTSITTILGMLPMALGIGAGNEVRAPLARAVIGGLTTSTLLTLVVVPVVYSIFETIGLKIKSRRAARALTPAASS
ncbi:MAG: efflux RND transporter permease subunit [bacterium]